MKKSMKIKLSVLISIFVFAGFYFLNPVITAANQREISSSYNKISNARQINRLIRRKKNLKRLFLQNNRIKRLAGLKLPNSLEVLSIINNPIQTYEGLKLPSDLKELYIGKNDALDSRSYEVSNDYDLIELNSNLDVLSIKGIDNVPWETLVFPNNLSALEVIDCNVSNLSEMILPPKLKSLDISLNPAIDENQDWSLISNLETLALANRMEDMSLVILPSKLKNLRLSTHSPPLHNLNIDIDDLNLPDTLEYLDVRVDLPFNGSNFPNSLKYLHLNTDVLFEDIDNEIFLPENLEVLTMEGSWDARSRFRGAVREMQFPDSLKRLDIHSMDISTIRELRNLPANLVELDLIDNNLATLDDFLGRDLPQSLRRLVLILNPISKAEKRRIRRYYKKTNPDLVIFFENEPRRKNRIPLEPEDLNLR